MKPGKHARSPALPLALTLGLVAAVGLAAPATAHVTVNAEPNRVPTLSVPGSAQVDVGCPSGPGANATG